MNEEVPHQVEQVEQVPQSGDGVQSAQDAQIPPQGDPITNVEGGIEVEMMPNREIIEALIAIASAMTMHPNLNMMPRVMESTMISGLRDFVRMNHPMVVTSREKTQLSSYQLRDVSQILYTQ